MIQDTQTMFSGSISAAGVRTGQAVTATAISANVQDTRAGSVAGGPALENLGITGLTAYLVVSVGQAFNNLTSLTITLESDSAAGLATAPVVHFSSGAIALAALTANTTLLRIPLPVADYKRYLGLRYTVAGTAPTTGTVFASIVFDHGATTIYPSGYTVDA